MNGTIKATYTAKMERNWFLEFIQQLAQSNYNQMVEIVGTGLLLHCTGIDKVWNRPVMVYSFTGTFGTITSVMFSEWLSEFDKFTAGVKAEK